MESSQYSAEEKNRKSGLWKKLLLGVVLFVVFVVVLVLILTKGITDVVNKQLVSLKKGDLYTAYSLTSKDFKNSVSFESFKEFVERYPSLSKNKSHSFTERSIENNIGTLKGTLESEDGAITPVEFKLIKEEGEWKIVERESVVKPPSPSINRIDTGTMVDNRGVVRNPSKSFLPSDHVLHVSVYVSNIKAGENVSATLYHLDSNSSVGPAINTADQDYESGIFYFEFTSPPAGWPLGNYRMVIIHSSGLSSYAEFVVRQ